jgi:hypothetical protein
MSELYEDLLQDSSESFEDGNYFLVTVLDLELGQQYPLQFKWKYKDGTLGKDWSAVYNITTPIKSNPNDPSLQSGDVVGGAGFIKVTWDGNDASGNPLTNLDRIDVHISGTSFGDGTKPAGSFKLSGTQTFSAEPGVYIVQLKAVTVNGATSFFSTARTVTVTAIGEVVQTPTLPSGLSVATAPFAVSVNWAGTYSSSTFTGFKSVDIYAVNSDLGSSVTSGITNTNLVGSLTVNNTPNKINVSLDNLRQALGLSTNSDVYSATIFYYFNATNTDGTKFGSPTYTRINSSSVVPTKANFIDLVSGVISIENLVAGNGNFSSWLRTGTAGGARIELSAVSDFSNNGYTVQKGLTAYSSGNTEIFKLDLDSGALTINGSGTFSGSLSAASGTFTGTLSAATGSFTGTITANGGTIGGITIAAAALQNNSVESSSTFKLDSAGKARFGAFSGSAIIIDPSAAVGSAYLYHSSNGGSSESGNFTFLQSGGFRLGGSNGINYNGSNQITIGSSGNPITINTSNGNVSISGTLTAGSLSTTGLTIASNGAITTTSGLFGVTSGGVLTATNANFSGTITGSIFRTTNNRIQINNTADQITFHPSSASNPGKLYMSSTSTVGQLLLEAPYNSTRSYLQMDTFGDTPSVELSASTGTVQLTGNIVRLNSTGSFFTGSITSDPASQTAGSYMGNDGQLNVRRSGDTPLHVHRYTGSGTRRMLTFYLSGSGAGGINADGSNAPIFASPSDYRLKENIRDFIDASSVIKKTKLKIFNFKNKPDIDVVGFIAHELAEVDPMLATGLKDEINEDGSPIYQDAMPGGLITYLTGALKETILKVEELQQRLDALEG